MNHKLYGVTIVLAAFVLIVAAKPPPRYIAVEFGTLPGGSSSVAAAINNQGQVVGYSDTTNGEQHSVLFDERGVTDLGPIYTDDFGGFDINDSGQYLVPGFSPTFDSRTVQLPDGYFIPIARSINNSGAVAGYAWNGNSRTYQAFVYSNSTFHFLSPLVPGFGAVANHINNRGQVAGAASAAGSGRHAVLYFDSTTVDLGVAPGFTIGAAANLNELGHVIGASLRIVQSPIDPFTTVIESVGFLYRDGTNTPLPTLPDYPNLMPWAINLNGDIVGHSFDVSSTNPVGTILIDGKLYDANSLVPHRHHWNVHSLNDINNAGWIVGTVQTRGVYRAILLKPIGNKRSL